jgi:CRP/FNR family transcriptional regulator, cyclic AMP receptor protein
VVDPDVMAAVAVSHLGELPPAVLEQLFTGAVRMKIPAGSVAHREHEETAYLELVVSGVIRVFVTALDGRTMTIRYCRPGELMGAMSLFSSGFSEPTTKQAMIDAELLKMSPATVRRMAESDVRVARVFLTELSERARNFVHEIPGSAFATVRQRVARQLLDLAASRPREQRPDGEFAVQITQQDLAAAAGTVREVVVRTLRQLREIGAVRTERDRIVILDPSLLTAELGWNSGP